MLTRLRYFVSDLAYWLGRRLRSRRALLVAVGLAGIVAAAILLATGALESDEGEAPPAPAPPVIVREAPAPAEPQDLGFPAFATKNTTRVAGADAIADAAGVALATFPSTGGADSPAAVTLVDAADWPAAIAASALVADPIRAPTLLTSDGEMPQLTADALAAMDPRGGAATGGAEAFRVGAAAGVSGLRAEPVRGQSPAEIADGVDALRERLTGEQPQHIVIATQDDPGYAMPAAGWAARSGDTILFTERDALPQATRVALRRHEGVPVYVLGSKRVISDRALEQIRKVSPDATRVGADGVVANAIAFARYSAGDFGWDVNDPGHGFVIASADRPLDAAAAAPLSASGTWGPLLVTNRGDAVPSDLQSYLLDVKPGYVDDPTRAVYNHVWLMGDEETISVGFQGQVDELAEVAPVRSGSGRSLLGPPPGTGAPEPEQSRTPGRK